MSGETTDTQVARVVIDSDGRLVGANASFHTLFCVDGPISPREPIARWFPSSERSGELLVQAAAANREVRLHARADDGTPFTALCAAAAGGGDHVEVEIRKIGGAQLLSDAQRYLDVAFEKAPIGMALFDTDGRYVRVNVALCQLLGRAAEELIGRRDQDLTHPEDRQSDLDAATRILDGDIDSWQCEKRFIRPNGDVVWAIANLTFLRDDDGRPLSWLGLFQDITQRKSAESRLRHLADHDELTGVANRRGLLTHLNTRLSHARRYRRQGALLLIDLDGFKAINDGDGHQAGDDVLIEVAGALRAHVRASDFVARHGGDEFCVVLPNADEHGAAEVAAKLLAAIHAASGSRITGSCGIVSFDAGTQDDARLLLERADAAMYAAKALGGNRSHASASA